MSKKNRTYRRNAARRMDTVASYGIALIDVRVARKTGQLCKEVSRTLACALGASREEQIRDLSIVAVEPAPDAARLLVTVCPRSVAPGELPQLRELLASQRGLLRTEVAAALQRRRTPELAFHVALSGWTEPGAGETEPAAWT